MRKFFAMTILLLMMSATCFAMTFQQPVEIGTVSTAGGNAITIDGTTNVDATAGGALNTYIKGTAIFDEALYLHFDGNGNKSFFGSSNVKNSVQVYVFEGRTKIYRLGNDAGRDMFLLATETGGGGSVKVIGNQAGKWVQFFDTTDARKDYGIGYNFYMMDFKVVGDEIIFRYKAQPGNIYHELHYKWDKHAQWFGVDVK
ncbi:MAG: hypothetical protein IJS69_00445 [Selenomonadaceae bacterium]|nr:hypothetical protein [Selenomonadaceae bacterium]